MMTVEYTATDEFTSAYPIQPENTSFAGVPDQMHQDYYGCVSACASGVGGGREHEGGEEEREARREMKREGGVQGF